MAKKLEAIVKENIDVSLIARAIRSEGYRIPSARGKKDAVPCFLERGIISEFNRQDRFQKLADGWVKDVVLGIEWGPSSTDCMSFGKAEKYCSNIGGRLPSRMELVSLIDDTKYSPAINKEIFPDTKCSGYWTSTTYAATTGSAWIVYFYDGYVGFDYKGYVCCVRPCRSSQ